MRRIAITHNILADNSSFKDYKSSNNEFQLWNFLPFEISAKTGIEILYPYESIEFEKCKDPFIHLSNDYFQLELTGNISTPKDFNLLIVPHNKFYTDEKIPLAIMSFWETDWWMKPINILFKYKSKNIFIKGQPIAQAIAIERHKTYMIEEEKEKIIFDEQKYITREDNLYNVLYHLNNKGQLPKELTPKKKYTIV